MTLPRVSVVMPVYNTPPDDLRAAIESVLTQTFSDFEFIIVDDGSTKNDVPGVVKSYKDARIKYIRRENGGVAAALNTGLDCACGEFVARMDSDDISLPDRFQIQVDFLYSHPDIAMVGTWLETFPAKHIYKYRPRIGIMDIVADTGSPVGHPSVMWRRADFEKYGLRYDPKYQAEDYELWSRVVRVLQVANIQRVLLRYRIGDENITVARAGHIAASAAQARQNLLDFISPDVSRHARLIRVGRGLPEKRANLPRIIGSVICAFIPMRNARRDFRAKYIRGY